VSSTIPIADVAEVLIRSTVNGKDVELCLWFRSHLGAITLARLTTICTRVGSAWRSNFAPGLGGPHLFREVAAIDRSPGSTLTVTITHNVLVGLRGQAVSNDIALRILNLTDNVPTFPRCDSYIYAIPQQDVISGVV